MTAARLNAREMELRLAYYFGYRRNLVVPNVSWGLPNLRHEADLVVVYGSGWASEIEIKVSRSDLRRDTLKRKWRWINTASCGNEYFREFWMAVPPELADDPTIPEHAGILIVRRDHERGENWTWLKRVEVLRRPKRNPKARKLMPTEVACLQRLAYLRVWSMKEHLIRADERRKESKP